MWRILENIFYTILFIIIVLLGMILYYPYLIIKGEEELLTPREMIKESFQLIWSFIRM